MRTTAIGGLALLLAGCAHLPGHRAVPRGGETITYELKASSFCLECASYTVTLGPDGQGIFTGGVKAAVVGENRFRATPEATRAFIERLAPYRPARELLVTIGESTCFVGVTDQDTLDIRWHSADGSSAHLAFYEGSGVRGKPEMREALASAPSLLPIADLIGPH